MTWGTILQGWALATQGQETAGITLIQQGLVAYQATGTEVFGPTYLVVLAEAYGNMGQTSEGLSVLTEARALVDRTGERWWEAELYRLKGEILLQQANSDEHQTETCFRQAMNIARRQQAKVPGAAGGDKPESTVATAGQAAEARQLLAEVYGWFTEGFNTADLHEAKALLEELS